MMKRVVGLLAGLGLAACGSNECRLDAADSCGSGLVCERVQGEEDANKGRCFAPVQLQGKVFNLESKDAIAGAHVTALDENGAPTSPVVVTDAQGNFTLRVPSTRTDDKGAFESRKVTLRASAPDFVPFPQGIRPSLPIDTSAATREKEEPAAVAVVQGPLTQVGLIPVPAAEQGRASITGKLQLAAGQPPLVGLAVAERGTGETAEAVTAVVGPQGNFTLFNVPAGSWTVRAYAKGQAFKPAAVEVASQPVKDVLLERVEGGLGTVSGSVNIVAAPGGSKTSVVLAVESTFNEALGRGEIPPGLRVGDVTNAFSIEGVPPGRYVVLAGFENDALVRDPDPNIAGTKTQRIVVPESGGQVSIPESFKVTSAITLQEPGAQDGLAQTGATPTFRWAPYSSARTYNLWVLDAQGQEVWRQNGLAAGTSQLAYGGPALQPGGIYQWRLLAMGNLGNPISITEDLRGVFQVQAQ
jgi:hypothetical protein